MPGAKVRASASPAASSAAISRAMISQSAWDSRQPAEAGVARTMRTRANRLRMAKVTAADLAHPPDLQRRSAWVCS